MILAIDVGNTHIVVGIYDNDKLKYHWRLATDRRKTEDEYGITLCSMLSYKDFKAQTLEGAIMASVVPPLTATLEKMVRKYFSVKPLIVGPGVKTGVNIQYDSPKEVGPDRIVNAVAAYRKYGGPAIVVDFGTATTFDAISSKGDYLGGAIAPGIITAVDALFEKTAMLPRIELSRPLNTIGKTTVESMQSGIIFGFAGQADAIVERMAKELGERPYVVATGGLAQLVFPECKNIDSVDPFLTLDGLCLIYKKNTGN